MPGEHGQDADAHRSGEDTQGIELTGKRSRGASASQVCPEENEMLSCESCQMELFPFVYDLLEPAKHEEVEEHLRTCPHCQLELQRTKTRSAELALAVRGSFTD